jgi:hypothetical protein
MTSWPDPSPAPRIARREFALSVAACLNTACAGTYDAFHKPEDVAINGYQGDAMEPFLTRDGRYLLFNNRNESSEWPRCVPEKTSSV